MRLQRSLALAALAFFIALQTGTGTVFRKPQVTGQAADEMNGRDVTPFDYGWRFHLGEVAGNRSCPADTFPKNMSGVEMIGLLHSDAQTLDDCQGDCCADPVCMVWQWGGDPQNPRLGCWVGQTGGTNPSGRWQGWGRETPRSNPPATSGPTSRNFNDTTWELLDVPHDAIVGGVYTPNGERNHGYLPFNTTWYRKHFNLPAEWKGQSSISLYFEGVFQGSSVYLNGIQVVAHQSGYTSFTARLDNASTILYGDGSENENVLVVHATASGGTGWWYEGGGIYRRVWLVRTPTLAHFVADGLYAMSNVTGVISMNNEFDPTAGMMGKSAVIDPRVEVVHDGKTDAVGPMEVTFTIMDKDGKVVGSTKTDPFHLTAGEVLIAAAPELALENVELWSSARPYLYTLQTVMSNGNDIYDNVSETRFGFRRAIWTGNDGFFLNDQAFKWRGFCDHNDFGGVGTALSERINLFRAMSMRSVGGNSWRMSHNPPVPALLDILDHVGVLVWDENRDFANVTVDIIAQRDMVRRDRNHPSVMCWSVCNELGCDKGAATGFIFKHVTLEQDPMRPVTANTMRFGPGNLSDALDVQGFSHRLGDVFDDFHSKHPSIPTIGSECCSCRTQRGEDVSDSAKKVMGNFNGDCLQTETAVEISRKFVSGIMVWTLFDYFGEPTPFSWPHKSSLFGSFDLSGFPKAGAYYYYTWWRLNSTNMSASIHDQIHSAPAMLSPQRSLEKTGLFSASPDFIAYIVEHWQKDVGGSTRTLHAYTNAPMAELFVNGKSNGRVDIPWMGYAEWDKVAYADGNVTVTGINHAGVVVASHTRMTPGTAVKMTLSLDAPSEETGTGTSLVLDGHDTALVRASFWDSHDQVVMESGYNVTFSVSSGPGKIIGVGNGDPQCHESNTASWRSTYHGLARAVVKVTEHHATTEKEYQRLLQIDAEGNQLTHVFGPNSKQSLEHGLDDGIVVEASASVNGKTMSSSVTIPVSTDFEKHGVLAVAKRSHDMR